MRSKTPRTVTPVTCLFLLLAAAFVWTPRAAAGVEPAKERSTAPAVIEGIVVGRDGRPVGDALVAVVPENSGVSEEATRAAAFSRTSRTGRFRFSNLKPGAYSLTATASGHTGAFQGGFRVKAGSTLRKIRLEFPADGISLGGSVRATSGEGIPGAEIRATRYSDFLGDVFYAYADSSGRFRIDLPRADYMLMALAPGREMAYIGKQSEETGALELTLARLYPPGPAPDEVVDWFRGTGVPLETARADRGLSDLRPLRDMFGKARVVSLGEATHGTREFFQLKHRMLEYLVREMGFTVFAIEASMPEGFDVNEYVLTGRGDPAKALNALYFWTWNTEEVLEMIRWMRRYNADPHHQRKVKFYGFDMQFAPRAAKTLVAYLRRVAPSEGDKAAASLAPLVNAYVAQRFGRLPAPKKAEVAAALEGLLKTMDSRRGEFSRVTGERSWAIARQHGRIVSQFVEMNRESGDVRDRSMAENVRWILDHEGPDAKIVVWAHNGHVSASRQGGAGMGFHLRQALGDSMVVVGFSFEEGSFQAIDDPKGGLREFTVGPAPAGSLEETLSRTGYALAAFDLRRAPRNGPVAEWLAAGHATRRIGAVFSDSLPDRFLGPEHVLQSYDALLFVRRTTAARPNHPRSISQPRAIDSLATNLDFETGRPGRLPPGWFSPQGPALMAYGCEISRDRPREGKQCALIRSRSGNRYGEWYGSMIKSLDAAPYRGKKVRLRGAVRVDPKTPDCRVYLWLGGFKSGFGSASETVHQEPGEPIRSSEWEDFEIVAEVPNETTRMSCGLALAGEGAVWLDSVSLEALGP